MDDRLLDELVNLAAENPGATGDLAPDYWESCRAIAAQLLDRRDRFLMARAAIREQERSMIADRWGPALEAAELHWLLCRSVALRRDWEITESGESTGALQRVLRQLFWAAHYAAGEALALLREGFPAGALARWRALCELEVRLGVIDGGGETAAEAYLEHEQARSHNEWQLLQVASRGAGQGDAIDTADMRLLADWRAELSKRRGKVFAGDYGWAHHHLIAEDERYAALFEAGDRPGGPLFDDLLRFIEHDAGEQAGVRWRYAVASAAVHGAPHSAGELDAEGDLAVWAAPAVEHLAFAASSVVVALTRITDIYVWRIRPGSEENMDPTGVIDQLGYLAKEALAAADEHA